MNDDENLVYKTIMKTYETKKKCEQWKKEHPVMPEEIIKQVKMEIPRFNTESFIDIRRRLQNKGRLIKVVENKLSIAVIVK